MKKKKKNVTPKTAKSKKSPNSKSVKKTQPSAVVGIGASAGGLEAFTQFLKNLPGDTGMAFILIQHLEPRHESQLSEILSRVTSLPVKQVSKSTTVFADNVYIIPPGKYLEIKKQKLVLSERIKSEGMYMPVDYFFQSLASDQKNKAIGIILSGTASDGTMGLKAIKAEGGLTFAQDEESAKYPGMPHSAIQSGNVDIVLPIDKIAKELTRIGKHPYIAFSHSPAAVRKKEKDEDGLFRDSKENSLNEIYKKLKSEAGVDFSNYKLSTIRRRINRRMVINKIRKIEDYVKFIKDDKNEIMNLYYDLLINVTTFFRDAEVFETLEKEVYSKLLENVSENNQLRVWIPGCSTGEEAYSIAISFMEFMENKLKANKPNKINIQIFATDISDPAIEKARAGVYPESAFKDLPVELQKRYFVRLNGGYQINKMIRDLVIFAKQDLVKDPPFSRIDLISCRNLLIYLSAEIQKKIIPTFHYALKPNGFLLLGTSESIGNYSELFDLIDKKFKIYKRKEYQKRIDHNFAFANLNFETNEKKYAKSSSRKKGEPLLPDDFTHELDVFKEADRLILNKYAPAAILINQNLDIIQFRGKIKQYLDPKPGDASLNLFKMIKEDVNLELHTSIRKASNSKKPVILEKVKIKTNGSSGNIDLEVVPLRTQDNSYEKFYLILFNESDPSSPDRKRLDEEQETQVTGADARIRKLKDELAVTKEHLQSIIEEREAANEELRSALEELQSSNEELQSTNEEMETAREELQSTNEELLTVNDELESRNIELADTNNDLNNILASVNIALLIVGRDLKIRRYTQKAEGVWNLIPSDIGRPFSHLKPNFDFPDLKETILDVMDELESKEKDIKDNEGRFYSMKIRPYKTAESKIDGAVISMYDIDVRKRAMISTSESEELFREMANSSPVMIWMTNADNQLEYMNKTKLDFLGKRFEDLKGKGWFETRHPDDRDKFREELSDAAKEKRNFSTEIRVKDKEGNYRWLIDSAAPRIIDDGTFTGFIGSGVDVTEKKKLETQMTDERDYFEAIQNTVREPLIILDKDLKVISANKSFYKTFKVNKAETAGRRIYDLGNKQWDIPKLRKLLEEILPEKNTFENFEVELDFENIGKKKMLLNARRIESAEEGGELILLAIENVK